MVSFLDIFKKHSSAEPLCKTTERTGMRKQGAWRCKENRWQAAEIWSPTECRGTSSETADIREMSAPPQHQNKMFSFALSLLLRPSVPQKGTALHINFISSWICTADGDGGPLPPFLFFFSTALCNTCPLSRLSPMFLPKTPNRSMSSLTPCYPPLSLKPPFVFSAHLLAPTSGLISDGATWQVESVCR